MKSRTNLCVMVTFVFMGTTLAAESCTVEDNLCDRNNLLVVSYNGNINCDDQLPRSATLTKPVVKYPDAEKGKKYLLVMVDPDAPAGCFMHDIKTMSLMNDVLKSDKTIVPYHPPSPPFGVHRYQFFLYSWSKIGDDVVYDKTTPFHLSAFQNDNSLGEPIAVFQFRVQHEY